MVGLCICAGDACGRAASDVNSIMVPRIRLVVIGATGVVLGISAVIAALGGIVLAALPIEMRGKEAALPCRLQSGDSRERLKPGGPGFRGWTGRCKCKVCCPAVR